MFRITRHLRDVLHAERTGTFPAIRRPPPTGPVVIWNLIRRCNLTCAHCYAFSADHDYTGELSTAEVFATLDDLKSAHVPALILSGGEPLLRPDLFDIAARAKALGFSVSLSTNGTLIDDACAARIAEAGFDYVGISLDGIGAVHDRFRRKAGAFDASLAAVRHLRAHGVRPGLRFTMTAMNAGELPKLLALAHVEDVPKFYFSHLNYAGRGNVHRKRDAHHLATRDAMDLLFDTAWHDLVAGTGREFVTGNNDADALWLLRWVQARFPRWTVPLRAHLAAWGGNASGVSVANIDNLGVVHPDTMWWHHALGEVRRRPFGDIWADVSDPLMAGLKQRPRPVTGRCGACPQRDVCGGNTRVRAQQVSGDPWAADPGCYLDDDELAALPAAPSTAVPVIEPATTEAA